MLRGRAESQLCSHIELEGELAGGRVRDVYVSMKLSVARSSRSFRDVTAHGDRRAPHLLDESKPLIRRKGGCESVDGHGEFTGTGHNFELALISHVAKVP